MTMQLVFLKLGGSLITIKDQPHTARPEVLQRLAQEIAEAVAQAPELQLVLGHGSGSFGHAAAKRYHTRQGVSTVEEWQGFAEVWQQAAELNKLVMASLEAVHLPVIVFPPSSKVITRAGKVATWDLDPLRSALVKGQLPVVYGDVVFDLERGGTILSTEELFSYLARQLKPTRLLFAGLEPGVWDGFPNHTKLLKAITPASLPQVEQGLKSSSATDVTGGMLDKVHQVISLVDEFHEIQGMIFSGDIPGNVRQALLGEKLGTLIYAA